jgi:hypothetical protein
MFRFSNQNLHAYKFLTGKSEGKKLLGRRKHLWEIILKLILNKKNEKCRLDSFVAG